MIDICFLTEAVVVFKKNGCTICEVPVPALHNKYKESLLDIDYS